MMSYYWQVIMVMGLLSLVTRSLPFLFSRFMTANFTAVGKLLPSYIMLILVIYEIDLSTVTKPPYAIPALLSLLLVTLVHVRFKSTFISLITGTTLYVLLLKM